jgi:hypothetical protein
MAATGGLRSTSRGRAQPHSPDRELPDPWAGCSVSLYFLPLEADLVGFLAGFAFALAIAMLPPSPIPQGSTQRSEKWGVFPSGDPRDLCLSVDGP